MPGKLKLLALIHAFLLIPVLSSAQQEVQKLSGKVYEVVGGKKLPVAGANIVWLGTLSGTITNGDGEFNISRHPESETLVVSFVGYASDTIHIKQLKEPFEVILSGDINLESVQIVKRIKSTELSMIDPLKIEKISEGELQKAACCNLSESFETNPSVDVSFTDAITGTKQIQMLGLAGPYTQITQENIPGVRGLLAIFGMEYTPGPWIESIQLNKGTGSVVNGYESIAGQINVELRKPDNADRVYLNIFGNTESRAEINLNLSHKLNEKWSSALLMHGRKQFTGMDNNLDGFIDKPIGDQVILLNRWKFKGDNGWVSQLGIKATGNNSIGGQVGYKPHTDEGLWGYTMDTRGVEGWMKIGRILPGNPNQSFGFQLAGLNFEQDSKYGLKSYSGHQQNLYANLIFQSILKDTRHEIWTGVSFQLDKMQESLDTLTFDREEIVPGVFAEYNFSPRDNFNIVAGIRADYHSIYQVFFTPRVHLRYAFTDNTVLRLSAGRGQRTASILAENPSVMASSRNLIIHRSSEGHPYGLDPEIAWNFGGNFTQKFRLDYRDGSISFDAYQTMFNQQVVTDLDNNPQEVNFYNLDGRSYSASFQSQLDYELIRRLDIRLAYRWYDVKTQYRSGLKTKPLVSSNRAFMNLAYTTKNHWKLDYTLQWHGQKRIPSTASNPEVYRLPDVSPAFFQMNAQVSKSWREVFDVYLGVENLLDYKQENPIVASDDPFGPYFDSSLIWGPVFGRMIYAGLRLNIK